MLSFVVQIKEKRLSFYKEIKILLKLELRREWRLKTGILGILLHIVSAIYICYISFYNIPEVTKPPLFWLIILFTTINGISKGFMEEQRGFKVYLNQLVKPESIMVSKLIYNVLLMVFLSCVTMLFYFFFIGLEPMNYLNYTITILLSVSGISVIFTMVSAIAANASKPGMLVPIMSLPLVLPVILIGIKASERAMTVEKSTEIFRDWTILLALTLLIAGMSVILFKYLRKE